MTVYLIAEVKVTDDAWVPDYAARVHEIAVQFQRARACPNSDNRKRRDTRHS
ncbi:DUF1330 domain-containing protein [Paracoccus mutanolyticus]|uniref:hypothetical protein n=1 Tax=Paracoccus mutanolyticus TaxID=1499308 RepID=UPI001CB9CE2D|nr:hypothetical protein [Paracoccus mutanolyticus]